jgi:hypothetical protein
MQAWPCSAVTACRRAGASGVHALGRSPDHARGQGRLTHPTQPVVVSTARRLPPEPSGPVGYLPRLTRVGSWPCARPDSVATDARARPHPGVRGAGLNRCRIMA